jgi:hypothetical protein
MAHDQSDQVKEFDFADMRADVLTLAGVVAVLEKENRAFKRLLCEAGYPRRGTDEETQTMQQFAWKVQQIISHVEAVEL